MKIEFSSLLLLLLWCSSASGYEVNTHRELSANAALVSNLSSRLPDYGIDSLETAFPSNTFHNSNLHDKFLYCFEGFGSGQRSVMDLIRLGALCEDVSLGGQERLRYTNHFYDPANNGRGFWKGLFTSSVVWGLEQNRISDQDFSYKDAREYFYKGLTSRTKEARDESLSKTFRTIGHVIHLVQDLGQPQHTRDESHGNGSLFESYTDDTEVLPKLPFGGYPVVQITSPSHIWETLDLKGLANFSNMNFVTKGANFDRPELYYYPRFDLSKRIKMKIEDLCANRTPQCPNPNLTGTITFYGNDVDDRYLGTTVRNPYASTESIFSEELKKIGAAPAFTLNRFNFELAHTFLIPRAVAYSAGLINYFFRGKIDFVPDQANPGKYRIKNLGSETMKGDFVLYYDAVDGTRQPVLGAAWNGVEIPGLNNPEGAANESGPLTFTPPTVPVPKTEGEYMLVFSGDMGEEKRSDSSLGAIAAKKIEPKGVLLISMYSGNNFRSVARSTDLGKTWEGGGGLKGYGALNFVGGNTVLSNEGVSKDGGVSWSNLLPDSLASIYRVQSAPTGDNRLIGLSSNGSITGVPRAYSFDKGLTWTAGGVAPSLQGIVRRPTYIGNNELVVRGEYYIGKQPCSFYPALLCDTYASGIFNSKDNGFNWNLIGTELGIGSDLLYIGKNKWTDGVLKPDEKGSPTLFSTRVSGRAPSKRIDFVVSTDRGVTWSTVGYPKGMEFVAPLWPDPWYSVYAGNGTILTYFHDQAWPPSDWLYISKDNGATWSLAGNLPLGTASVGLFGMTYVGNNKTILGLP